MSVHLKLIFSAKPDILRKESVIIMLIIQSFGIISEAAAGTGENISSVNLWLTGQPTKQRKGNFLLKEQEIVSLKKINWKVKPRTGAAK